jgi:hypothetical protein
VTPDAPTNAAEQAEATDAAEPAQATDSLAHARLNPVRQLRDRAPELTRAVAMGLMYGAVATATYVVLSQIVKRGLATRQRDGGTPTGGEK